MRKFLFGIIAIVSLLAAPLAPAQQSSLRVGDGGTTFRLLKTGRVTLVAGVATVTDSAATTASNIFVYKQAGAGTQGVTYLMTRSAGSFTITAKAADGTTTATGDTSQMGYLLVQYK